MARVRRPAGAHVAQGEAPDSIREVSASDQTGARGTGGPQQDAIGDFAADLGSFLGGVQNRATGWLDQRKAIAAQLTQIRDTANHYLEQLSGAGQGAVAAVTRARRGRPPGNQNAKRGRGRPKENFTPPDEAVARPKRTMSAEARQRISAAQKKRWKAQRAGNK
jgi:hypothetical protein